MPDAKAVMEEWRQEEYARMSEKNWQERVRRVFLANECRYYHTTDSRHSPAGFLDVLALTTAERQPRLIVAELKTEKGKLTGHQEVWLAIWRRFARIVNDGMGYEAVVVRVWRPSQYNEVVRLAGGREPLS